MERGVEDVRRDASCVRRVSALVTTRGFDFRGDEGGEGCSRRVSRRRKHPRRDRIDDRHVHPRERLAGGSRVTIPHGSRLVTIPRGNVAIRRMRVAFARDGVDFPARRAVSDGGDAVGEYFARDVGVGVDGSREDDVDDGDVRDVRSRTERRASRGDERAQTRGARKQRAPANAVIAEDGRAGRVRRGEDERHARGSPRVPENRVQARRDPRCCRANRRDEPRVFRDDARATPERSSADERADEVRSTTACALTPLMPNALHPANASSERITRVIAGRGCLGATRPPPPADAATTCALICRRCAMGGQMPRSMRARRRGGSASPRRPRRVPTRSSARRGEAAGTRTPRPTPPPRWDRRAASRCRARRRRRTRRADRPGHRRDRSRARGSRRARARVATRRSAR